MRKVKKFEEKNYDDELWDEMIEIKESSEEFHKAQERFEDALIDLSRKLREFGEMDAVSLIQKITGKIPSSMIWGSMLMKLEKMIRDVEPSRNRMTGR